jgi:hypothetical protein
MKHLNREAWLEEAVELAKPLFEKAGYTIPKVRVSTGWPVRGGMAAKKRVIGECWSREAASDTIPQIFISPWLQEVICLDGGVLPTLVHEICHAVVGNENKHNKVFRACARSVGLEGKITATHAGDELKESCRCWSESLGEYPHCRLSGLRSPHKKQGTRMIKIECDECGYVARTVQKWIDEVGPAHCPDHGEMRIEVKKDLLDE